MNNLLVSHTYKSLTGNIYMLRIKDKLTIEEETTLKDLKEIINGFEEYYNKIDKNNILISIKSGMANRNKIPYEIRRIERTISELQNNKMTDKKTYFTLILPTGINTDSISTDALLNVHENHAIYYNQGQEIILCFPDKNLYIGMPQDIIDKINDMLFECFKASKFIKEKKKINK